MGKRSAVVALFLGDMGSIQRELRPSTQREDQLTMETKLEQIAAKAVNQLPKSVVREIRTPRSVGAGGGRPPPATRWDGKRSVAEWPKLPRPSSTLPLADLKGTESQVPSLSLGATLAARCLGNAELVHRRPPIISTYEW